MLSCFNLSNQVALVTGGSQGIGKAIAKALAQSGAKLAIVARTQSRLEAACREIQSLGTECIWISADISDEKQVQAAVKKTVGHYGRIDILVNDAAAGGTFKATEDLTLDDWRNVLKVNVEGMFLVAREVARHMIRQRAGKMVFISSIVTHVFGTHCDPNAYETSKGALDIMIRALAVSWAKYNINVNGIAPGYVMSDAIKDSFPEDNIKKLTSLVPMGRFAEPEEIAAMAVALSSDAASYMQGSIITIDGGRSLI